MTKHRTNWLCSLGLAVALGSTGCGYEIARFAPGSVVRRAEDRRPIPRPVRRLAHGTLYQLEARTEHHVVQGMVVSEPELAGDVNRLDEVVASTWHRGSEAPATLDDYVDVGPPVPPLVVMDAAPVSADLAGDVVVRDERGEVYDLFFDPPGYPSSRTVAWPVASRLVHALGYHCVEVHVTRAPSGRRAVAVRRRSATDLGPTPMLWTRSDDANDTIEREDRRSLRASLLWMKWLDVTQVGPATIRDFFVGAPTAGYVEHRIVDLSAAFGVGRLDESIDRSTDPMRDNPGAGWMLLSLGFAPDDGPSEIPSAGMGLLGYRAEFRGLDREVSPPFAPHDHARPDDLYWMARRMAAVSAPVIDRALEAGQLRDVDERNRVWRLLGRRRAALQLVAYSLVTPVRPRHVRMLRSSTSWSVELALVDDEALLRGPFERSYEVTVFSRDGEELAQSVVTTSKKRFGVAVRLAGEPDRVVVLRVTRRRQQGATRPMEIHVDTTTGDVIGIAR